MDTEFSHESLLDMLHLCGAGMASVDTPRGSVTGTALPKGDRFHVSVYTLEDPTVSPGKRHRTVMERWAASSEEAACILRQGVLRHAKARKALHEAQRRIYTPQSVRG
jgi:hypothetical protein